MNIRYDRGQLSSIVVNAKDAMGAETLDAVADKGYFKGEDKFVHTAWISGYPAFNASHRIPRILGVSERVSKLDVEYS